MTILTMSYILLEFTEVSGGGLAIVKRTWLTPRKKEVFWPPIKDQKKFNRLLLSADADADPTWKLYEIERIFCETDDFEDAQEKLSRAQVTSNLSEKDEENFNQKRKRIAKKIVYSSDSDEESVKVKKKHTSSSFLSRLPSPPPIESTTSSTSFTSTPSRRVVTPSPSNSFISATRFLTPTSETGNPDSVIDKKAYEVLLSNLITVKEQNKQILSVLNKSANVLPKLPAIEVDLPLKDDDSVKRFEAELHVEDVMNSYCSYLATLGGRDLTTATNRVLRYLLTDCLAANYSYLGKKSKKAFVDLINLKKIIFASLKVSNPASKEKDIEDVIKIWLKHAPQRKLVKLRWSSAE